MKDYIEERAVEVAYYIIETKATVRQAAKKFGISKSTVPEAPVTAKAEAPRAGTPEQPAAPSSSAGNDGYLAALHARRPYASADRS